MKKIFLLLAVLFSFSAATVRTVSGQSLSLDTIFGWPDTVVDNQTCSLTMVFSNSGGAIFSGDLTVFLMINEDTSTTDTLYHNPQYQLSGNTFGDTISVIHVFTAAEYDAGDNIVVVWPASSQLPTAVVQDSLLFLVIFDNVGIQENQTIQSVELFPTPAGNTVQLYFARPEKVEQVRVFDIYGKEIFAVAGAVSRLNTANLSRGIYFLEVRGTDGTFIIRKFLKQ